MFKISLTDTEWNEPDGSYVIGDYGCIYVGAG